MKSWARLNNPGTGTRLYITSLYVTEKVINLQGFISIEEIKLVMLLRNSNFLLVRNPYRSISLFRIHYKYYWFVLRT